MQTASKRMSVLLLAIILPNIGCPGGFGGFFS
jgi:hypothetical protein